MFTNCKKRSVKEVVSDSGVRAESWNIYLTTSPQAPLTDLALLCFEQRLLSNDLKSLTCSGTALLLLLDRAH
jgi:hypothetical protein